jgi:hypothetical protein
MSCAVLVLAMRVCNNSFSSCADSVAASSAVAHQQLSSASLAMEASAQAQYYWHAVTACAGRPVDLAWGMARRLTLTNGFRQALAGVLATVIKDSSSALPLPAANTCSYELQSACGKADTGHAEDTSTCRYSPARVLPSQVPVLLVSTCHPQRNTACK